MGRALALNPRISLLKSQIKEAWGELKIAQSALYPRLDFFGDFEFTQITRTGEFPTNIPGFPFEFGLWNLQLNLYYDFDIWDKNKDRVQRYLGIERSRILDYEWGAFILSLNVADAYFKWLFSSKMWQIQNELVQKQQKLYQITLKTVEWNLANALDSIADKVNVERAKEDLNAMALEKETYADALRALVGNFCEPLFESCVDIDALLPFHLPKCLTLDLVGRRMDIQSQVWLIESACKQIQISRKEFYPDFDLTAFFGFSTIHFNKLFDSASTNWMIAPALHLPIFHGGELYGNLIVSQAEWEEEIAEYNQMVLDATREILDALAALRLSEATYNKIGQEISLIEQDISLQKARIAHNLDSIPLLIQKQIGLLNVCLRKTQMEEQIVSAILELIRSTGG